MGYSVIVRIGSKRRVLGPGVRLCKTADEAAYYNHPSEAKRAVEAARVKFAHMDYTYHRTRTTLCEKVLSGNIPLTAVME